MKTRIFLAVLALGGAVHAADTGAPAPAAPAKVDRMANARQAIAGKHWSVAHKGAHEYIGEAYLLQGKPAEAEMHLVKLEQICGGRGCEEYQDLAKSISEWKAKR